MDLDSLELVDLDNLVEEPRDRLAHWTCGVCSRNGVYSAICGYDKLLGIKAHGVIIECVVCNEIYEKVRKCPFGHFLHREDLP